MANFIPRLEWNDINIVGDSTIGSNVITNVVSTASVIVGMIVNHANFPANSAVVSKTSSTVTLGATNLATASGTALTLPLFQRFDFTYPCDKQTKPTWDTNQTVSEVVSGKRQVSTNNILKKVNLSFKFVSQTEMDNFESLFYLAWAVYAYEFRYFESKDVASSENYEMESTDFKPSREFPSTSGFKHGFDIKLRKVYL